MGKRRFNIIIIAFASVLLTGPCTFAQLAVRPDSSYVKVRGTDFIAPGVLIGAGLGIHYLAHDTWDASVREDAQSARAGRTVADIDNYIQYLPAAMDLGLGFTGVKCENCFMDRLIEGVLAYCTCAILNNVSKWAFNTMRPNGSNNNSFPSGHTVTAFTGAELVRMEYGWGWGAGAYAIAGVVGGMRIYKDWHWFSDVLAGAGIGILSANIGRWLRDPVKDLLGIHLKENMQFGLAPGVDCFSGTPYATVCIRF